MRRRKSRLKKGRIFFTLLILILIIFGIYMFINSSKNNSENNSKLKDIGYSDKEIKEISKLSKKEINIIEKNDYNENILDIIDSKSYNKDNLAKYLKYTKDNDIKVNDTVISFMNEKYYINEYLDRYLKYNKEKIDNTEIVKRVNSNLDKEFYKDVDPADISKGMYTLVNKFYYLDKNYVPEDIVSVDSKYTTGNAKLNKTALDNFIKMADAASTSGLTLLVTTGYRDYNFQKTLYNNYVASDGVKQADTYSARPGYSEHQLGYSVDLSNKNRVGFGEFENTSEFDWLEKNAYKYGFIRRYTKETEYITGYVAESWHYRYVGEKIAKYIYENKITYEEYYAYFLR